MSIFKEMKTLVSHWEIVERRKLTSSELSIICKAYIANGKYGPIVEFEHNNGKFNLPLLPSVWDKVDTLESKEIDPKSITLVTLQQDDDFIYKVEF